MLHMVHLCITMHGYDHRSHSSSEALHLASNLLSPSLQSVQPSSRTLRYSIYANHYNKKGIPSMLIIGQESSKMGTSRKTFFCKKSSISSRAAVANSLRAFPSCIIELLRNHIAKKKQKKF